MMQAKNQLSKKVYLGEGVGGQQKKTLWQHNILHAGWSIRPHLMLVGPFVHTS